jgi:hypothetical protein
MKRWFFLLTAFCIGCASSTAPPMNRPVFPTTFSKAIISFEKVPFDVRNIEHHFDYTSNTRYDSTTETDKKETLSNVITFTLSDQTLTISGDTLRATGLDTIRDSLWGIQHRYPYEYADFSHIHDLNIEIDLGEPGTVNQLRLYSMTGYVGNLVSNQYDLFIRHCTYVEQDGNITISLNSSTLRSDSLALHFVHFDGAISGTRRMGPEYTTDRMYIGNPLDATALTIKLLK